MKAASSFETLVQAKYMASQYKRLYPEGGAGFSETLVPICAASSQNTLLYQGDQKNIFFRKLVSVFPKIEPDPPERWYVSTKLHGCTYRKTVIFTVLFIRWNRTAELHTLLHKRLKLQGDFLKEIPVLETLITPCIRKLEFSFKEKHDVLYFPKGWYSWLYPLHNLDMRNPRISWWTF
jgi:hypothetical protein